jgi:hypothetical protein
LIGGAGEEATGGGALALLFNASHAARCVAPHGDVSKAEGAGLYIRQKSQSDGRGAAEFRGTATKSLQNFGAPRSRLEIPEWFGRPYLRPYSVVAL